MADDRTEKYAKIHRIEWLVLSTSFLFHTVESVEFERHVPILYVCVYFFYYYHSPRSVNKTLICIRKMFWNCVMIA